MMRLQGAAVATREVASGPAARQVVSSIAAQPSPSAGFQAPWGSARLQSCFKGRQLAAGATALPPHSLAQRRNQVQRRRISAVKDVFEPPPSAGVAKENIGGVAAEEDGESQEASEQEAAQRMLEAAGSFAEKEAKGTLKEKEAKGTLTKKEAKGTLTKKEAKGTLAKKEAKELLAEKKAKELEKQRLLMELQKAEEERAALVKREEEVAALARKKAEELKRLEDDRQDRSDRRTTRLPKLQEEHEFIAAKMFFFPEVVKAGEDVEIFFHRPASVLKDKPGVFIVGGYNDWEWENFQAELRPSGELTNDWWSVTLRTPNEAFLMNFVFHSSDNVYENNEGQDFYLRVEGEWDEATFEAMLNLKKREEAERAAAEEAERDRIAREERRKAELKAQKEAEQAQARNMANEARERLGGARQGMGHLVEGVWYTKPERVEPGKTVTVFYNRAHRPLANREKVFMHAGVNNWEKGVSIITEFKFAQGEGGDWWSGEVEVPSDAVVLNWVMADGPPGGAGAWDNNSMKDYAAPVGDEAHVQALFDNLEARILAQLEEERRQREEEAAALNARRLALKEATRARTKETFLQSQAHVFYTEPVEPRAGQPVKVFYNPSSTVLHGRTKVWMKGGYNRWTHRAGCFMPVEMTPAPNGTHFVAEVTTPEDAYIMDIDFLDSFDPNTATYDNRRGLDYHVPLAGATVKQPPLHIVHIALEMAPVAKVGGLGDVVTSLSRAVQEQGHLVEVVLPKYDCLKYNNIQNLEEKGAFSWGGTNWRCWLGYVEGVPTHFIEPENGIFWVGCVYGRKDDASRFYTFCNAALEFLVQTGRSPDILHCHDWSSAPAAWLHAEQYRNWGLGKARTVFTIHNLEFGQALIGRAMEACNMATTVSPTYAWEIGGNAAVKFHLDKFHGILNGIDPDIWDPLVDKFIPMNFTSEEVVEGKRAARHALWQRLNLRREERPLVGIITRLTAQKGIHLIKHAVYRALERGCQVVLLGSAPDPRVQKDFENMASQLANSHADMARFYLSYDEPLSHLIYAGCDMILVPSMFEPCGLTQLTAMRYGAIPVVRKTGGLNDTVFDVDNDKERAKWAGLEPNGFSFEGADTAGMDYALNRAISAWYDGREWWNGLAKTVMEQDWSWNRPALDYMEVYYGARK